MAETCLESLQKYLAAMDALKPQTRLGRIWEFISFIGYRETSAKGLYSRRDKVAIEEVAPREPFEETYQGDDGPGTPVY